MNATTFDEPWFFAYPSFRGDADKLTEIWQVIRKISSPEYTTVDSGLFFKNEAEARATALKQIKFEIELYGNAIKKVSSVHTETMNYRLSKAERALKLL